MTLEQMFNKADAIMSNPLYGDTNEAVQAIEPILVTGTLDSASQWSSDFEQAIRSITEAASAGDKARAIEALMEARSICHNFLEESKNCLEGWR